MQDQRFNFYFEFALRLLSVPAAEISSLKGIQLATVNYNNYKDGYINYTDSRPGGWRQYPEQKRLGHFDKTSNGWKFRISISTFMSVLSSRAIEQEINKLKAGGATMREVFSRRKELHNDPSLRALDSALRPAPGGQTPKSQVYKQYQSLIDDPKYKGTDILNLGIGVGAVAKAFHYHKVPLQMKVIPPWTSGYGMGGGQHGKTITIYGINGVSAEMYAKVLASVVQDLRKFSVIAGPKVAHDKPIGSNGYLSYVYDGSGDPDVGREGYIDGAERTGYNTSGVHDPYLKAFANFPF